MKPIGKIGTTLALALALSGKANAQLSGSVEGMISTEENHSYVRGNAFYTLPGEIKGYTFLEAYPDDAAKDLGKGFFGKTTLRREIVSGIDGVAQLTHLTGADDKLTAGLRYNVPTPTGTSFALQFFPAYWNTDLKRVENKTVLGYSGSAALLENLTLSSFAEINLNGKKGTEWGYGEASLMWKLPLEENVSVGWTAGLRSVKTGDIAPRFENRFELMYNFK